MRDVAKDVSEDDDTVVRGRTHTQEELAASWPLRLAGQRVLIALTVSGLFGILAHHGVLRRQEGDAIGAGMIGVVVSAFMLMFLALALTGGRNPVDWLRQYWRRNVRGYAVAYWLDNQGKLTGQITCRLGQYWRSMSDHSPTIYLPLGGWLHRPCFADRNGYLHQHGIRVRWPWFEPVPDKVWVVDGEGARVKLWMADALILCGTSYCLADSGWLVNCSQMLRNLERLKREQQTSHTLLLDVYDRIVATKRFIKSTQAQAIADELRQKLHGLLPYEHPRFHEFARRPVAKAAPSAAKT